MREQSATFGGGKVANIGLGVDHSGLNKFGSRGDASYKMIVTKLCSICHALRTPARRPFIEQADAWIREKVYCAKNLEIVRLSEDALPMERCYINLAIVEMPKVDKDSHSRERLYTRSSKFTLSARLKLEDKDARKHIGLPQLFESRKIGDQEKIPRRILIWGRAGVGKTTLCKKLVQEFTHGTNKDFSTWRQLFDRVLWVSLRNLKRQREDKYNLGSLFTQEYFSNHPLKRDLADTL